MSRLVRKRGFENLVSLNLDFIYLIDHIIMEIHVLKEDEFDYIWSKMTESEIKLLFKENYTIREARQILKLVDNLVNEYYQNKQSE